MIQSPYPIDKVNQKLTTYATVVLGATALLSRVLLEITVAAWRPSFVFALVPKNLAAKGAHLRYGYCHCEPGRWIGPDQQVTEEDYLIWIGANDMANLVAGPPQGLRRGTAVSAPRPNPESFDANGHLTTSANA